MRAVVNVGPALGRPIPTVLRGPVIAIGVLVGLETLSRAVLSLPHVAPIYLVAVLVAVVGATLGSGLASGLTSAFIVVLHALDFFSVPGSPFQYTVESWIHLSVLAVIAPTASVVTARLGRRVRNATDAVKGAMTERGKALQTAAELVAAAERHQRFAETLLRASEAVGSTLDGTEIFQRLTRELVRTLDAEMGGAWGVGSRRDQLIALTGSRVTQDVLAAIARTPSIPGSQTLDALQWSRQSVFFADSQADLPSFDHPAVPLLAHKSILLQPIAIRDEVVGLFVVVWARERHTLTEDERRLADAIARHGALVLERVRSTPRSMSEAIPLSANGGGPP
ncbi:MAG: GAF domain-containing protein [Candidatus Rokubacteria bacterium]|nr:GAF domain-containing protein [Candidatus Rokubacteria bacterium]